VQTEFEGLLPLDSSITSKFGPREINGFYWGIDLGARIETVLPSTITGKVSVNEYETYGKHIYIDDGNGTKVLYAYLSEINFSNGSIIIKGQVIGKSGNTGYYNAKNKETGQLER
jgi:murein DD-endopeptidase MepM/ murein hydrolase activator NlpD